MPRGQSCWRLGLFSQMLKNPPKAGSGGVCPGKPSKGREVSTVSQNGIRFQLEEIARDKMAILDSSRIRPPTDRV
jgi:hypothetical protein